MDIHHVLKEQATGSASFQISLLLGRLVPLRTHELEETTGYRRSPGSVKWFDELKHANLQEGRQGW